MSIPESTGCARLVVGRSWDGALLAAAEHAAVTCKWIAALGVHPDRVQLTWDAPHTGRTPAPSAPPGFFDELWRFEVVEAFIAGSGQSYLEFEMGPFGHYAAFAFDARRTGKRPLPVRSYECGRANGRFQGCLEFAASGLPQGSLRWNAHRIDGAPDTRQYFSAIPGSGTRPDFHDLQHSVALIPEPVIPEPLILESAAEPETQR